MAGEHVCLSTENLMKNIKLNMGVALSLERKMPAISLSSERSSLPERIIGFEFCVKERGLRALIFVARNAKVG